MDKLGKFFQKKIYRRMIKCGFALCITAFVLLSASLRVSAEQLEGVHPDQAVQEEVNVDNAKTGDGERMDASTGTDVGENDAESGAVSESNVVEEGGAKNEEESSGVVEIETEESSGVVEIETEESSGDGETETEESSGEIETEESSGDGETETEESSGETETEEGSGETETETEESSGDGETETEESSGDGETETEESSGDGETETEESSGDGEIETEESSKDGETESTQPLLETTVIQQLMNKVEVLAAKTPLETECEALGLICSGTEITGYDSSKIGEILEIPEGITLISGMSGMQAVEVILPSTLEEIASRCFMQCPNLKRVSLKSGSSLWAVYMSAFNGCLQLETIDFSNSDFTQGLYGDVALGGAFGNCPSLKYVYFSQRAIEVFIEKGVRPFDGFTKFTQFSIKSDASVSSEAELCSFWKSKIADMVSIGLVLENIPKAVVTYNGAEIDITKRLQTQNIADAYIADNLDSQQQEWLWTSCFNESTAKTAKGLVSVSTGGSAGDGLYFNSFADFYKSVLKEGNISDIEASVQSRFAGVFSNVLSALVTKTQAIPKTFGDLNISTDNVVT